MMHTQDGTVLDRLPEAGHGGRISLGKGGQELLVAEAAVEDSGTYTCTAHNAGGSDSTSYNVSVLGQFIHCVRLLHKVLFVA